MFAFFWAERLAVREGSLDVVQPAAGFGEVCKAFAVKGGFERSTVGVAAEDDVLYLQDFYGIFDGGRDAVYVIAADGNDVADAAGEEEISGAGLEDQVGDDAGVRAGDEEPLGGLHLGEEMVLGSLLREDVAEKAAVAFDEGFDMRLFWIARFVHNLRLPWIA